MYLGFYWISGDSWAHQVSQDSFVQTVYRLLCDSWHSCAGRYLFWLLVENLLPSEVLRLVLQVPRLSRSFRTRPARREQLVAWRQRI